MTVSASPLAWPAGWIRTAPAQRRPARFGTTTKKRYDGGWDIGRKLTVNEAVKRVREELRKMRAPESHVVISTNLELRLDGLPRSGQRQPADPGVAVYWRDSRLDGWPMRCMAVDHYDSVADNLAAVAATLEALRAVERHGGAEILDRAYTGFAALPAPETQPRWWDVLDKADPEGSYRRLRSLHHPDNAGSAEQFQRVQTAWDDYKKSRSS